ncbi:MAG: shikimate kinase [Flavobacteriales bacterium]
MKDSMRDTRDTRVPRSTVVLIGFMCSGKSTVGKALADALHMPFRDLDRMVEAEVGPLLPFFRQHGEEAFRRHERQQLERLLDGPPIVLATGGGTPCEGDAMELLLRRSTVVWLDVSLPTLMPRILRAGGDRPLLFGLRGEALTDRVMELLVKRTPVYGRATLRVEADGPVDTVVERIIALLGTQER